MGKPTRARRRNAAVGSRSVEFGDLLDPIAEIPAQAGATIVAPITVAVPSRHAEVDLEPIVDAGQHENLIEVTEAPQARFADSGTDDDRLPLHFSTKRRRRQR